ncbi:MAG TPA: putative 2OG-Fe(II) oxygenase [Caulobacterales bacterium]|nr:putative 2OG-Fe(II) oxygenase [Caulobacterales bacterium]
MAISRGLDTPMTRLDRAIILDESGDSDALRALESVAAETKHPDIAVRLARALYAHARKHDAKNMLDLAVRTWPDNVDLYVERARLQHWDGDPDEGASAIEAAVRARPYDMRLRLACADVLRRSGAAERALEVLREGLRFSPESAELLTSVGVVLDDEDRIGEALEALRAAAKAQPESFVARQNLASVLLRAGAPDEAHAILNALRLARPLDQSTIGYEALALRMLGDPRYGELYDYTRLVRAYDIQAPAGFASADEFNQALAERLRALHISTRHPLNQSLRGGTQTDRSLPLSDPLIGAFFDFARQSVEAYAGNLDEASSHPVDARKAPAHRVAGSWSVRLAAGGFHINHVHPAGWLSSAYYVEVPPDVADEAAQAGWLKFGEPASATPGCTPDFAVQPKVGRLVLFPSYMWHGTVPFAAGAERLTIAFDVVPSPLTSPGR